LFQHGDVADVEEVEAAVREGDAFAFALISIPEGDQGGE
jgi:hypothetical protein